MPVVPGLTTTVFASQPYYRITSASFLTRQAAHHKKVVNGEGGLEVPMVPDTITRGPGPSTWRRTC